MTAYEQLLSLANILNASEFLELARELAYYESGREALTESTNTAVRACFALIKSVRDTEREADMGKKSSRSEAGKMGAMKRWGNKNQEQEADSNEMAKNSNDSKNGNAINAILSHSEPFSGSEEEASPFSPSPTPPATQSTPEEEKETLSKESTKKKPQTLEERKIAFGLSLEQYTGDGPGQFPREMVNAFYRYWTEASPGGVKMLWEKQKTFDPRLRLENWKRREEERDAEKKQRQNKSNYGTGHKQTDHRLETDFSGYEYESTI